MSDSVRSSAIWAKAEFKKTKNLHASLAMYSLCVAQCS